MNLNEYLKDLEYLSNIDSGPGCIEGLNKVADFFSERFIKLDWEVKEFDFSPDCGKCIICTNRPAEHYDLFMIGHLDTVFPEGSCSEHKFHIEGNKAYGLGTVDMKQGSLLMYYLLKDMPKEITDKLNIVAVFNPDEEIGSIYSKTVYMDYARKSDYGFLYEDISQNSGCCSSRKGAIFYTIDFEGKAGHCAYAFSNGARSAIHEMGRWIVKFDSMISREKDTTVNIGLANGGIKGNVVAPSASMKADIRIALDSEIERFDNMVEEMLCGAKERGIKVNIKKTYKNPFVRSEKANEYLAHLEKVTAENGIPFKHSFRGGVSDANIMSPCGIICLDGLGPSGDGEHSTDEYLDIDSVIPTYNLSMFLIKDLAENKNLTKS